MDFAPTDPALSGLACVDCGIGTAELSALSRHITHLSSDLPADMQRSLRAHLFALLAGADRAVDAATAINGRNEYRLLNTQAADTGSMSA